MFKIGQTDCVTDGSCQDPEPLASVKNYLYKMAKNASELPCPVKARSDLVTLAVGAFPSCDGSNSSSGCCGGSCSKGCCGSSCSGNKNCSGKSGGTCGGTSKASCSKNISPRLDPAAIPASEMADVRKSRVVEIMAAQSAAASTFKSSICDQNPYPECKYCKWASQVMSYDSGTNMPSYMGSLQTILDSLARGNVDWANMMLSCPGQLAAMINAEYGLGAVVGHTVAAAVIGATAVHGALMAYGSMSRYLIDSDYRCELEHWFPHAIQSGGYPSKYTSMMNDIAWYLGVDMGDAFRTSSHNYQQIGHMTPDRYEDYSGGYTCSETAKRKANACKPTLDAIKNVSRDCADNPVNKSNSKNALGQAPSSKTPVYVVTNDSSSQPSSKNPTTQTEYFYKDEDGNYVKIDDVPSSMSDGSVPLEPYRAEHGEIYIQVNPIDAITTSAKADRVDPDDRVVDNGDSTILSERSSDTNVNTVGYGATEDDSPYGSGALAGGAQNSQRSVAISNGTIVTNNNAVGSGTSKSSGTNTTSTTNNTGTTSGNGNNNSNVVDDGTTNTETGINNADKLNNVSNNMTAPRGAGSGGDGWNSGVNYQVIDYSSSNSTKINGTGTNSRIPAISSPLVLDSGLVVEDSPSISSRDYEMVVDTTTLNTRGKIGAAEMSRLSGIDMSVEDLKIAYLLDSEMNGSEPPYDVQYERIPTILDNFPEW